MKSDRTSNLGGVGGVCPNGALGWVVTGEILSSCDRGPSRPSAWGGNFILNNHQTIFISVYMMSFWSPFKNVQNPVSISSILPLITRHPSLKCPGLYQTALIQGSLSPHRCALSNHDTCILGLPTKPTSQVLHYLVFNCIPCNLVLFVTCMIKNHSKESSYQIKLSMGQVSWTRSLVAYCKKTTEAISRRSNLSDSDHYVVEESFIAPCPPSGESASPDYIRRHDSTPGGAAESRVHD